jgi:hypothetical protein
MSKTYMQNMQNMYNNMHNMTDMNPPSYICIICTPHFADGPPGPLLSKLAPGGPGPYKWAAVTGNLKFKFTRIKSHQAQGLEPPGTHLSELPAGRPILALLGRETAQLPRSEKRDEHEEENRTRPSQPPRSATADTRAAGRRASAAVGAPPPGGANRRARA